MRAHAAAEFNLTHFGVWRWVVRAFSVLLVIVAAAWLDSSGSPAAALGGPVTIGAVLLLLVWLVAVQPRDRPVSLRWDGQRWHFGMSADVGHEPLAGELSVTIDLGHWMLLRFKPDDRSARPGATWIPAQRAGHTPQWHTLRCAVYSPRPDTGADAAPDV